MTGHVIGYCPMGCGYILEFGAGRITCTLIGCPCPDAVSAILADRETDHVVELGETEWTIRHPLRERLDDQLITCDLHSQLVAAAGPPQRPGRYRVRALPDNRWSWTPLT